MTLAVGFHLAVNTRLGMLCLFSGARLKQPGERPEQKHCAEESRLQYTRCHIFLPCAFHRSTELAAGAHILLQQGESERSVEGYFIGG
jgi:hypothetical protein